MWMKNQLKNNTMLLAFDSSLRQLLHYKVLHKLKRILLVTSNMRFPKINRNTIIVRHLIQNEVINLHQFFLIPYKNYLCVFLLRMNLLTSTVVNNEVTFIEFRIINELV